MKKILKKYLAFFLIILVVLLSNLGQLVFSNEQFEKEQKNINLNINH